MTPEERAKAFVQSYGCGRGADYPCTTQEYCPCFGDVVHAFRQAENDKLEEAARMFEADGEILEAASVRSLIQKD